MPVADLKQFILEWNNLFPFDKWWRDKYHVPFGSEAHMSMNQADILIEYLEAEVYEEYMKKAETDRKKAESLKKGEWISSNDDVSDELFDQIVI